jgi:hypothetical protein
VTPNLDEHRASDLVMGSSSDFDFWLGEWQATWDEGRAAGRNSIVKEYGGNVVYERFDGRPGIDLVGMSVSVYREAVDRWFQTWVDDSGNYFALRGGMEDGEMVLLGEQSGPRGRVSLRMRFSDIEDDRFTWRWESSKDDGATWETLWELAYRRAS